MRERYREWGWGLCYGVEREREREKLAIEGRRVVG